MPKFYYIATDRTGKSVSSYEEALSHDDLVNKLQAKDLIIIKISQEPFTEAKLQGKEKSLVKRKRYGMKSGDLVLFCRQLATLLAAGVTILKSLDIICKQVPSVKFYNVLSQLQKNMEQGLSLHAAMAKHPKIFSDLWVNLVESGEASGNLSIILDRLATYLERNAEFKKKLMSSMAYPVLLLLVGFGALLFMTIKIIPTFAELFKGFKMELPYLTKVLIMVSDFIRTRFILVVLLIAGVIFIFKNYTSTESGRRKYEKFKFQLPLFGDFFRALAVERFSSELSTLIESGVPILYSLEISEKSVGNIYMADIIRDIKDSVREGKPLSIPLEKSGFFEPMVVQMVNIGEEVGELSPMLKKINNYYQSYVENFLSRISALFEPLMLLFMGGVIGLMVVGMFLPIFQLAKLGSGG